MKIKILFALLLVVAGISLIFWVKFVRPSSSVPRDQQSTSNTAASSGNCDEKGFNGQLIGRSDGKGNCILEIPIENNSAYRITFPDFWTHQLAGAAGVNLMLNEGKSQQVFVQTTVSNLTIEDAYKATTQFEMSGPQPVIDDKETVLNKQLNILNTKKVLVVNTKNKETNALNTYYVVKESGKENSHLFFFKISSYSKPDHVQAVERMASSLVLANVGN